MVGHNPGLEDFALMLAGTGDASLRAALEDKFPTATLARIDFSGDNWTDITGGSGTLVQFVRPRDFGFNPADEN
jgi:phosphohistidine phosphatase